MKIALTALFFIGTLSLMLIGCMGNKLYQTYVQVPSGRLYLSKCVSCHGLRQIESYSFDKWKMIVQKHQFPEHQLKARARKSPPRLSDREFKDIIQIHPQVIKLLAEHRRQVKTTSTQSM